MEILNSDIISKMFLEMFKISVASGIGILIILAVSPLFGRRHTVFWRYVLWAALAVRLVFPFDLSIPGKAVVLTLPEHLQTDEKKDTSIDLGESGSILEWLKESAEDLPIPEESIEAEEVKPEKTKPEKIKSTNLKEEDLQPDSFPEMKSADFIEILIYLMVQWSGGLWAAVAVALFCWQAVCYQIFCRRIEKEKIFLTTKENLSVYISSVVSAPVLVGIIKPMILLPHGEYNEEELQFILEHEYTHYRRKDLWVKFLLLAAKTIHWFNPFVAFMAKQAAKDIEFLCDTHVVKNFSREEKKKYGEILLSCAVSKNDRKMILCTSEFSRDAKTLKERFANIFSEKSRKKGILAAALGVGILLAVSFFVAFGSSGENIDENAADLLAEEETRQILDTKARLKEKLEKLPDLSAEDAASAVYGAVFPKLVYASEERAVIYDDWGLLIYDIKNQKIEQLLDLKAADLGYIQGDQVAHIEVSDDGRRILFYNEPKDKEKFIYYIEEKRLEYSDLDSFGEHYYDGVIEREEQNYVRMENGKLAYLSADSLYKKDGDIFHEEDMQGLSLIVLEEDGGSANIYPLFSEVYESNGEQAEAHLKLENLRKVVGRKYLYEDEDGWTYYLEEDEKKESPLWEIAGAVHPLLLTRYKEEERQVLENLMYQYTWLECPVLFAGGRIVYKAAPKADIMGVKDPALVSIAMDGSDRKTADEIMYNTFDGLCEDGGWIYYSGWSNDGVSSKPLCRIAPDFSSEPKFVEEIPGLLCGVMDGFVYYLSAKGQASGIWKRNLSTGEEAVHDKWGVSAEEINLFNVRECENILELSEEPESGLIPGCQILFYYDYDGEIHSSLVPFY